MKQFLQPINIQNRIYVFFLISLMWLFINSCNLINPDEDIPAYIKIDSISLTTNVIKEGSNSHKIVDAWIYLDNNPIGVYQLPCNVPVLEKGMHKIDIRPGVLQNGISNTHLAYPFYQFISKENVELKEGQATTIENCVTSYFPSDTFPIIENFDNGITFFNDPDLLDTNTASAVFEGNGSGYIKLANGQTNFEIKSTPVQLPKGDPVYLEMNYKTDLPFTVGLETEDFFGNKTQRAILIVNAKSEWNKIYIELAPTIVASSNGYKYSLIFGTERSETPEAYIFLDNIKVVHY